MYKFEIFLIITLSVLFSCTSETENQTHKPIQEKSLAYQLDLIPFKGKNQKWGYYNLKKEVVIAPKYDEVHCFNRYDIAFVVYEGVYRLINKKGDFINDNHYKEIISYYSPETKIAGRVIGIPCIALIDGGLFSESKKKVLINEFGEIQDMSEYDYVEVLNDTLLKVEKNRKYGLINTKGKIIITCKYDYIDVSHFSGNSESQYFSVIINNKYGILDNQGKEILPCEYDYNFPMSPFYDTYAMGQKIWISTKMPFYEPPLYPPFAVSKNKQWGYVNENNKIVIAFGDYLKVGAMTKEGFAIVQSKDSLFNVIDRNGKLLLKKGYDFMGNIRHLKRDNVLVVGTFDNQNEFMGVINMQGKILVPFLKNESIVYDDESKRLIKISYYFTRTDVLLSYSLLSLDNKVLSKKYNQMSLSSTYNLFMVKDEKERVGFIDIHGKEIIPCQFKGFSHSYNGVSVCREQGGKFGFINLKGQQTIKFLYDYPITFENGFAQIEKNGNKFFIDSLGHEYVE